MKRLLKSVFAALKKAEAARPAQRPQGPSPAPALGVRSQVKAGSIEINSWSSGNGR
jgi:hypothetical protein